MMKSRQFLLFSLILLCLTTVSYAQTDPIHSSRKIAWNPGIPGGIPNRTTICATLNPGATAAQINSALANCPEGQVVFLNAGTYNITGIDFAGKSNVTLRGAGPDKTFLVFAGNTGCQGLFADICIRTTNPHHAENIQNQAAWTAGYAKGTTQITLTSVANITPGQTVLILDQRNDSSDPGTIYVCTAAGVCVLEGGAGAQRTDSSGCSGDECRRSQQQLLLATAVNGNTVTISPGLYMPNWRADRVPGAWWANAPATAVGIEDLSLDHTNSDETTGIAIMNAYKCWVKNVKSKNANRNHVWLVHAARNVIRDSYFYGGKGTASLSYGIEFRIVSDTLVENNIFNKVTAPLITGAVGGGDVVAYNYTLDNPYYVAAWMIPGLALHGVSHMMLFEGNDSNGYQSDPVHGTRHFNTVFRNHLNGWESGKNEQTIPIHIYFFGRYDNIVGNLLGEEGYHNNYQSLAPNGTNSTRSIFTVGWSEHGVTGTLPNDPFSHQSMMRWGNYDTVTHTARFEASEVPSGISPYGNPVPPDRTLPNSLYLSARPAWFNTAFGNVPWPPAGPDVTGGNVPNVGGHAYKIPARLCYENSPKDGSGILTFNADSCYGNTLPRPAPPANLTVVVR